MALITRADMEQGAALIYDQLVASAKQLAAYRITNSLDKNEIEPFEVIGMHVAETMGHMVAVAVAEVVTTLHELEAKISTSI